MSEELGICGCFAGIDEYPSGALNLLTFTGLGVDLDHHPSSNHFENLHKIKLTRVLQ